MTIEHEAWEYKTPFRVSRGAEESLQVVVVTLTDAAGRCGRGEAAGVDYDGETTRSIHAQLESVRNEIERGIEADALQSLLPAGGARNALDCALWDLRAKRDGRRAWASAQLAPAHPLTTAITFGIDSDEVIQSLAERYHDWPMIKIKVDAERHVEVVRRVRARCPKAAFIVDPNQAWDAALLHRLTPDLKSLGVLLLEQPVPRGSDESLRGYRGLALAADESVAQRSDLAHLSHLYQVVNVKLDKTGGLTEALATAHAARALGLKVMVGCMAGTSLAMAPAMVVGQLADFIDLDGPLLHARDRPHGIVYERGQMQLPTSALWG